MQLLHGPYRQRVRWHNGRIGKRLITSPAQSRERFWPTLGARTPWIVPNCLRLVPQLRLIIIRAGKCNGKCRYLCRAIKATIARESIPPERNTPIGTSLIIYISRPVQEPFKLTIGAHDFFLKRWNQYRSILMTSLPKCQENLQPGSSFFTPRRIVRGDEM